MTGPLEGLEMLPPEVAEVAGRATPIPTIARAAGEKLAADPSFVRADIGQVVDVDPELEVLYGPPAGLASLRAVLAETWSRSYGMALAWAPHVCVTTGAAEALSLLLRCVARDAVVALPKGHWGNYRNAVTLAGGRAVVVDAFEDDGRFDADAYAARLESAGARVMLANFPANPTGAVLDAAEVAELARIARALDLVVIADEVYGRLRYDGGPPLSLLPRMPERAVVVGSASKAYLLPGARVGWVVAANADLTDRVLPRLVRATSASPNVLGQRALLARLEPDLEDLRAGRPPALLEGIRLALAARRDALLAALDRQGMSVYGRGCGGTIFLVARLPEWWPGDDDEAFAAALLEAGVSVVPGSAFGLPGTVRFSFGPLDGARIARLESHLSTFRTACR